MKILKAMALACALGTASTACASESTGGSNGSGDTVTVQFGGGSNSVSNPNVQTNYSMLNLAFLREEASWQDRYDGSYWYDVRDFVRSLSNEDIDFAVEVQNVGKEVKLDADLEGNLVATAGSLSNFRWGQGFLGINVSTQTKQLITMVVTPLNGSKDITTTMGFPYSIYYCNFKNAYNCVKSRKHVVSTRDCDGWAKRLLNFSSPKAGLLIQAKCEMTGVKTIKDPKGQGPDMVVNYPVLKTRFLFTYE